MHDCFSFSRRLVLLLPPFIPDSALEIEPEVRDRCKPGTAKTAKRIVSRSWLALGSSLRFVSRDYPYAPKPSSR
jgi:hypothetical protein